MGRITRRWLEVEGACNPDFGKFVREFGDGAPLSRANYERAKARGMNMLWFLCHLAGAPLRQEFVAFTVVQRLPAIEAMGGIMPPPDAPALQVAAEDAQQVWAESEEIAARSLSVGLRELARDMELRGPTPKQAEEAGRAAARAASYAGLSQDEAAEEQLAWLAERLIPEGAETART